MLRAVVLHVSPSPADISALPFRPSSTKCTLTCYQFVVKKDEYPKVPQKLWGKPVIWMSPTPLELMQLSCKNNGLVSSKSSKPPRVLIIGAGGIGCELLKTFVLRGIRNLEIVDSDTIDSTNLNRQFLFSVDDIGKPKSQVAARVLEERYQNSLGCNGTPFSHQSVPLKIKAHVANIKDTERFPSYFFRSFSVVCSGVDNVSARKHLNRMCCLADVPLVESGTMGLNGQIQPIKIGESECYDCHPKSSDTRSFAVCTIHAHPTTMFHCVHYARELFDLLFGGIDHNEFAINPNTLFDGRKVFESVFNTNNIPIAKNSNGHHKAYSPLILAEIEKRVTPPSLGFFTTQFLEMFDRLHERAIHLTFDKNDSEIMAFVVATANLRAHIFHIPTQDFTEIQTIAGNITPAVATTNVIIAAMAVGQSLRHLYPTSTNPSRFIFLRHFPQKRKHRFIGQNHQTNTACASSSAPNNLHSEQKFTSLQPTQVYDFYSLHSFKIRPNVPNCLACSKRLGRAQIWLDTQKTTVADVVSQILRNEFGLHTVCMCLNSFIIYETDEFEDLQNRLLSQWFSKAKKNAATTSTNSSVEKDRAEDIGNLLPSLDFVITDESQKKQWNLAITHIDKTFSDQWFKLVVYNMAQKKTGVPLRQSPPSLLSEITRDSQRLKLEPIGRAPHAEN